jgi:hypothetical protein
MQRLSFRARQECANSPSGWGITRNADECARL